MASTSKYKAYLPVVQHYLVCLIAFFLSLWREADPILIGCLALCWLCNVNLKTYLENFRSRRSGFLFISLYILYAIGVTYSSNKDAAGFDMQEKLSLLIFPLIFCTSNLIHSKKILEIFLFFYAGAFAAIVIELVNAALIYANTSHIAFFYMEFSIFMHPTYFAMYLVFAIASMAHYLINPPDHLSVKLKYLFLFLIAFFTFAIILLSSKAGIICSVITMGICLLYFLIRKKRFVQFLAYSISMSLIYFITINYVVQHDYQRLEQAKEIFTENKYIDKATPESNRVRTYIWEASLEIIKNNFLFGVGTGDIHESLNEQYKARGMTSALKENLNAHNQFIQTFIAIGITGFGVLFLSLAFPFIQQIKKRRFLIPLFIFIVAFNFLFESILELQAGVLFYAFFNSLLLFSEQEL